MQVDRRVVGWSLLAGLALWMLWGSLEPHFWRYPTPDESTLMYEGWRTAQGDLPYRDFFEFIMPGTFFAVAGVIGWVGNSMVALRVLALLVLLGLAWVTVDMGRRYLPWPWLGGLLLLFWMLHLPAGMEIQHHSFSTLFLVLAVWASMRALEPETARVGLRQSGWMALGGLLAGVSVLFTQSVGALGMMALGVFWLVYGRWSVGLSWPQALGRSVGWYALPALLPLMVLYGVYAAFGALEDLWYSTVMWVMSGHYAQTSSKWYFLDGITKLVNWWPHLGSNMTWLRMILLLLFSAVLPILGLLWPVEYFAGLRKRQQRWQSKDWRLALLWLVALALFVSNFSYPTTRLIALHGWLYFLLGWVGLYLLLKNRPRWRAGLCAGYFCFALWYVSAEYIRARDLLAIPRIPSYGTVERELVSPWPAPETQSYVQMLTLLRQQSRPGKTVFIYNLAPEIYMAIDRHPPIRYHLLMAVYNSPAQIGEAVSDLRRNPPDIIVYDNQDTQNFRYDLRFRNLRHYDYRLYGIEALVQEQYELMASLGNIWIFGRRGDTPESPSGE